MKSAPLFSLVFAASVLVVSTLVSATPVRQSEPPATATASDDPGAQLLTRMCNKCHDSSRIVERRRTKDDWQDVLLKMIEKGATGEEKEFEAVFGYLCRNHGEIYVNDATPQEFMMVLGLTRKRLT